MPTVSAIIPAYNREGLLDDALRSAYAQGCEPMDVLVVDAGSTDGTARVVASFGRPVIYVRQEHRGVSAARNRGLAEARGELIAFLDSDDVWPEGSLRHRMELLAAHPEADIVYGKTRVRTLVAGQPKLRRYADGEAVHHPCFGSMLVRRSAFERVGKVDETFRDSEDIDWLCRAHEGGLVTVRTDQIVLEYRLHDGNMTSAIGPKREFLFQALKRSLDRRRRGTGS